MGRRFSAHRHPDSQRRGPAQKRVSGGRRVRLPDLTRCSSMSRCQRYASGGKSARYSRPGRQSFTSVPNPDRYLIRVSVKRINSRNHLRDALDLHLEPIPDAVQQGAGDILIPLAALIPQRASRGDGRLRTAMARESRRRRQGFGSGRQRLPESLQHQRGSIALGAGGRAPAPREPARHW